MTIATAALLVRYGAIEFIGNAFYRFIHTTLCYSPLDSN